MNFSPALSPGASTYFALESAPNFPQTTAIATTQAAAGARVASHAVVLFGHLSTGMMTFQLFRSRDCAGRAVVSASRPLAAAAASSSPLALGGPGTYRWRVGYAGDPANAPATTACGGDEIVVPKYGNIGLPSIRRCVSSVSARLHVRRRAARSSRVFVNGHLAGRLSGRMQIHIRRRAVIDVIASTRASGFGRDAPSSALLQQVRTYPALLTW